jgi:hypothetical protein
MIAMLGQKLIRQNGNLLTLFGGVDQVPMSPTFNVQCLLLDLESVENTG